MPITHFQREILRLLAKHRDPGNYVAGGVAIHSVPNSKRYSKDIDFFHDVEEAVLHSASDDEEVADDPLMFFSTHRVHVRHHIRAERQDQ